jgi:hypothetical protein
MFVGEVLSTFDLSASWELSGAASWCQALRIIEIAPRLSGDNPQKRLIPGGQWRLDCTVHAVSGEHVSQCGK